MGGTLRSSQKVKIQGKCLRDRRNASSYVYCSNRHLPGLDTGPRGQALEIQEIKYQHCSCRAHISGVKQPRMYLSAMQLMLWSKGRGCHGSSKEEGTMSKVLRWPREYDTGTIKWRSQRQSGKESGRRGIQSSRQNEGKQREEKK